MLNLPRQTGRAALALLTRQQLVQAYLQRFWPRQKTPRALLQQILEQTQPETQGQATILVEVVAVPLGATMVLPAVTIPRMVLLVA